MAVTEWFELRSGFIVGDVIKWRDPGWQKGRKKQYTGEGFGGQQRANVGRRVIAAEVIEGPDEDGWCSLLVMQYDNHGMTPPDKILMAPPIGKKIKRKYKTIMNGEPERLPWEDENLRAELFNEVWGRKRHAYLMTLDNDEEEE
jgi:hypothetical protein